MNRGGLFVFVFCVLMELVVSTLQGGLLLVNGRAIVKEGVPTTAPFKSRSFYRMVVYVED